MPVSSSHITLTRLAGIGIIRAASPGVFHRMRLGFALVWSLQTRDFPGRRGDRSASGGVGAGSAHTDGCGDVLAGHGGNGAVLSLPQRSVRRRTAIRLDVQPTSLLAIRPLQDGLGASALGQLERAPLEYRLFRRDDERRAIDGRLVGDIDRVRRWLAVGMGLQAEFGN